MKGSEYKISKGKSIPFNDYEIRGDVTAIFLENKEGLKKETLIDTKNLERIKAMDLHWHLRWDAGSKQYYAHATGRVAEGQRYNNFLHCVIMNFDLDVENRNKYVVDHINHNDLDNRECNLRIIERVHNSTKRKTKNSNNKSGYRNVCMIQNWWCVQVSIEGKNTILAKFRNVDEAGAYAEVARQRHYGEFAGKS